MHLKRQKIPKNWPVARKGTKYVVKPLFDMQKGVPLLVVIRDVLNLAQNRKEVKKAIHMKNILINNKPARDEKNSILLFDTLTLVPSKKSYRMELSDKGKIQINEIKESEADKKISKVVDKKILKRKKTQLNLSDGRNFISDIKCNTNDSVLINFKEKRIDKCIPLKENSEAIVVSGKHSGKKGVVKKLDKEKKMAELEYENKPIKVLIKQLMAVN